MQMSAESTLVPFKKVGPPLRPQEGCYMQKNCYMRKKRYIWYYRRHLTVVLDNF